MRARFGTISALSMPRPCTKKFEAGGAWMPHRIIDPVVGIDRVDEGSVVEGGLFGIDEFVHIDSAFFESTPDVFA